VDPTETISTEDTVLIVKTIPEEEMLWFFATITGPLNLTADRRKIFFVNSTGFEVYSMIYDHFVSPPDTT
jgi:hypothetical protein